MRNAANCLKCGAPLLPDARDSVCPKCLLALALVSEPGEESADTAPSPPVITEGPGTIIGRYKLLEQIGEGGFGVVYMAEQEEPVRRRVALKIIKLGMDTKEVIARFEAERQALALMDHPNIAKVFDGGATDTGRPYFVMELVRGVRITDFCDRQQFSPHQRLELFMQVCQAVQHAHQKGIIHRDLKPSNILVTVNDGVPVPKVIDFGIAKATEQRLTNKTLFTRFLHLLGTPAYMSPEQVELTSVDVDTRSDIYSLGVLLYELLTGKTPFDAQELLQAGVDEMRRRIREEEPPKPSTRLTQTLVAADVSRRTSDSGKQLLTTEGVSADSRRRLQNLIHRVRGDLDWIVMKCLEKERTRRYETASALAADLARHLKSEPVLAGPPSTAYRIRKFVRRHRAMVTAIVAVIATVLLGVIVSAWQWRKAVVAQRGEAIERKAAETNAAERLAQLVRLHVANGGRALETHDWFGALLWFTEALRQDIAGTRAEAMQRSRIGAILQYAPRLTQVWFHDEPINQVAFSLDGRWALTASEDGTARLWDVVSGQPGAVLRHGTNVLRVAFSADARRVLTIGQDGTVKVWNPAIGQMVCPPLAHGYPVSFALFSSDGQRVFTAGALPAAYPPDQPSTQRPEPEIGELRLWDTTTGQQVRPAFRQPERIMDLALSPDGRWLAASLGWSVMVWDLREPQALHLQIGTKAPFHVLPGLAPSQPDAAPEIRLPDLPPRPDSRDSSDRLQINRLAFSPDNQRLLTGHGDSSARIWSLPDGGSVSLQPPTVRGRRQPIQGVHVARFSPDGLRVILVDTELVVRLWDARSGEALGQLDGKMGLPEAFSPDGRFAYLSGQIWDMEADKGIPPGLMHPWLYDCAFGPDGVSFLTSGRDGTARLWNVAGAIAPYPPFNHDWPTVSVLSASPATRQPGTSEQEFKQLMLSYHSDVSHAAFSADSRLVVTASWNGSARVWDAATGQATTPYVSLGEAINAAGFNPAGTRFVTAGGSSPDKEQGMARIWDARTGQPVTPVIRHPLQFESAAFSPDGQWLITQTRERAQVWDAQTGEPVELPAEFGGPIRALAVSPDGHFVAVCAVIRHRPGDTAEPEGNVQESTLRGRRPTVSSAPARRVYQTQIWGRETHQPTIPPLTVTHEIVHLDFSPDGRWVLSVAQLDPDSVEVRIWNVATGQPVTAPVQGFGPSPEAIFTPDGRHCFVIDLGAETVAWELPTGRALGLAEWQAFKLRPDAITTDGQRVAKREDRGVRVLDAVTGDLLTPVLQIDRSLAIRRVIFSPDGNQLLTLAGDHAQLWPLPKETRPVEDLVLLAQLLSARKIASSGNYAEWSATAAIHAWQVLRQKHPASFRIAPAQVQCWRERQVEQAEAEQQWFAAAYHLDQWVKERPNDKALRLHLARARNNAALQELR